MHYVVLCALVSLCDLSAHVVCMNEESLPRERGDEIEDRRDSSVGEILFDRVASDLVALHISNFVIF